MSAPPQPVRAPVRSARWSAPELLPPLAVVLLGTVLLLPGHGLWFDELFTAADVQSGPENMMERMRYQII